MEYPREITAVQTTTILISSIIGVGVLHLPYVAVQTSDTAAPLTMLSAIILISIALWILVKLGLLFPDQSIIGYSEVILGKWLGRMYSLIIIVFFTIVASLTAREFGEVVITSVLKETPLEVTVIVMLFMAALSTRNDFNTFSYIHHFYVPIILVSVILIVSFSLINANPLYLQPFFSNDISGMLYGLLRIVTLFQSGFILTIIIPHMQKPQKAMKASVWGVGISGGLYFIIVIAAQAVFGSEEIKNLIWPTLELARTTSIPGNLLQRLDILFLAVWVIAVFTTIFSNYMLALHAASQLFGLRDHKMFSFFLLPLVFIVAMIPKNIFQMYDMIKVTGLVGHLITIVIPASLLLIVKIRRVAGKRSG